MSWAESILHVDMDAFFVEVERLRDPGLRGKPVAVGGGGNRGVVASASYEARAYGVRSAMPTSSARRSCPHLLVVPPDHEEYRRVSEAVFAIFRETTPLVEGLSLDEAFLDVKGLRLHASSPVEIARRLRERIRSELGLPASVGVAASKFVAKLASDAAKPDGLLHVPATSQLEFVHRLGVRSLWGVGEATHAALSRLGITTVGELAATPVEVLERGLGASLARHLHRLANAEDPRPVIPDVEAKSISTEETFEVDLKTRDEIVGVLRVQSDKVASRLRRAGMRGRTVGIKIRYSGFETISRSETLPGSTDVDKVVFETAVALLSKVDLAAPVRLVGLSVTNLGTARDPQQLTTGTDPRWESVGAAMDSVRARFGDSKVAPARSTIRGAASREDAGEQSQKREEP